MPRELWKQKRVEDVSLTFDPSWLIFVNTALFCRTKASPIPHYLSVYNTFIMFIFEY